MDFLANPVLHFLLCLQMMFSHLVDYVFNYGSICYKDSRIICYNKHLYRSQ